MAYSFKRRDATLTDGLRRIAASQLDAALGATAPQVDGDAHGRVHDARKRAKKLRGLLRLVRPAFDDYSAENAALRDAARHVSEVRDATALLETYDTLTARHADALDLRATGPFRAHLTRRRDELDASGRVEHGLLAFHDALRDVRARSGDWTLDDSDDAADVIAAGIAKTVGRARDALEEVRDTRDAHDVHELRKRVKYNGYHARLVKRAFRPLLEAHAKAAGRLSDLLGDHHDLHVFEQALADSDLGDEGRLALRGASAIDRERLEHEAFALAHALYVDDADDLADRWAAWWRMWRRGG